MKPVLECKVKIEKLQLYCCELCPKAFIHPDELSAHHKLHENRFLEHVSSVYVKLEEAVFYNCDSCTQIFVNKNALLLHRVKHVQQNVKSASQYINTRYNNESIPKPFQCPDCECKFAAISTLEAHSIVHEPYPHVCHCGIGYYQLHDLRNHIKLVKCKPEKPKNSPKKIVEIEFQEQKDQLHEELNSHLKENINKKGRKPTKSKLSPNKKRIKSEGEVKPKRQRRFIEPLNINFEIDEQSRYTCPLCLKSFASKESAGLHYRTVHKGERPYHCQQCTSSFTQAGGLKNHIKAIHDRVKDFECSHCDKTFISVAQLIRHERTHTGYKPYKCTFCEKAFSDPSAYARHKRIHTGDYRYRCELCPKAYTDNSALYQHKKRHAKDQKFTCNKCDKKFYIRYYLERHIKTVHNKLYDFTCDHCNRDFSAKNNLISHIQRAHSDNRKRYKCHICYKQLATEIILRKHIEVVHENKKRYRCEYCYREFSNKCALEYHIPLHTKDYKYQCDICKKKYHSKSVLRCHIINVHTGLHCKLCYQSFTSSKEFKNHMLDVGKRCDKCDKKFLCQNSLKSHIYLKHVKKEQAFECDYCGRVYSNRRAIIIHIAIYHIKPRFTCDHCGKKFSLKKAIRSHMMSKHLKVLQCATCYKRFCSKTELYGHKQIGCTRVDYRCDVCDKVFKYRSSLKMHSVIHMDKNVMPNCPICGKVASTQSGVFRHIRLVHGKKNKFKL